MHTKPDAASEQGRRQTSLEAGSVAKDGAYVKENRTVQAGGSIGPARGGPVLEGDTNGDGRVDLLDLSNMVDWLGFDDSRKDWSDRYVYFDFNGNGIIDIYDIAYVARLINAGAKSDPARLTPDAEGLNMVEYTEAEL